MSAIGTLILPIAAVFVSPHSFGGASLVDALAVERLRILEALQIVESGGLNRPTYPDGDRGRSIGPLQIGRLYWRDAVGFDPSLGGRYEDCRAVGYARRVVRAYMRRYVPEAWATADAEVIARTHNGGPRGPSKRSTLRYWEKFSRVLASPAVRPPLSGGLLPGRLP